MRIWVTIFPMAFTLCMSALAAPANKDLAVFSPIHQGHGDEVSCQRALFATGEQWRNTHRSPLIKIHPAFSKTAKNIYFFYDIVGLQIFLEQGPYGGSSLGSNKISSFYLKYDPRVFSPGSFFRLIFGNKPLDVLIKDADFSRYYRESWLGEHEIMQIRIPIAEGAEPWDLSKSVQLIISRNTGQVFGYGRTGNPILSFVKDIWLELSTERLATKNYGHGIWYNSDSGLPLPNFYQWALEKLE